ncbi:hypothetical protein B0T16DRAFT_517097, partial [Cercophora newfieldiana]
SSPPSGQKPTHLPSAAANATFPSTTKLSSEHSESFPIQIQIQIQIQVQIQIQQHPKHPNTSPSRTRTSCSSTDTSTACPPPPPQNTSPYPTSGTATSQTPKLAARTPHSHPQSGRRSFPPLSASPAVSPPCISRGCESQVEIWHDYLSVPQWTPELKREILCAIPGVFQRAERTMVFMEDVTREMVDALYHGATSDERRAAITHICAAAWYKRVWTVLEFVRSYNVGVILQGYEVLDGTTDVFLSQLQYVWDAETAVHGAVQVEDRVRIGMSLVPWNLGPLREARGFRRIDFASVWILLSRRGCRSIQDFWHALLGILRADIPVGELDLEGDPLKVCMAIVKGCLMQGDYSPLLMTPTTEPYDRRGEWRRLTKDGFNDVTTFGLGTQISEPELHGNGLEQRDGKPMLQLVRIGRVSFVFNSPRHPDPMVNFSTLVQIVLGFTGPDPDGFATTICSRLYFLPQDQVSSLLSSQARRDEIQAILQHRYNSPPDEPADMSAVSRLAELLGLTQADAS